MNTKTISALAAFTIASMLQAELFVDTLAATDLTGDSALLNMTVSGDVPGTRFVAQMFDFGISSGSLNQHVSGYDYGKSLVFDPIAGENVIIESYNVRDRDAVFEVIDVNTLYNFQTLQQMSASAPLTLNLWNLPPETTYYVQASAMEIATGIVYLGDELSFTTPSYADGGFGIQFGSGGSIPEPSSIGLWIGLGMIGMIARRRQRR
jgi:hypothetical protein|tara:strand:- start:1697 stop:2317 length:621 start_codon:yes stop_codon:yes gene_type:complete